MSHVRQLPKDSQLARAEMGDQADWGYLAENVAQLLDVMNAWFTYEYQNWTADPDEVEAERNKRKRAGIKPPPFPLIQPIAARPPSRRDALIDEYMHQAAEFRPSETGERLISTDELDALLGL